MTEQKTGWATYDAWGAEISFRDDGHGREGDVTEEFDEQGEPVRIEWRRKDG